MTATAGRFDALFATLAQQHDGVEALLDSFFDFMHRKTDFYVVTSDPARRKMGFLPGQAQQKVLQAFLKHPFKDLDGSLAGKAGSPNSSNNSNMTSATKAKPINEDKTRALAAQQPPQVQTTTTAAPTHSAPKSERPTPHVHRTESGKQHAGRGDRKFSHAAAVAAVQHGRLTQHVFVHHRQQVYVEVPPGTRSRDLDCKITASHVRIAMKSAGGATPPLLLDGDFPEKIRADESVWSLESGSSTLQISLEKIKKTWWASALKGDDEIDTGQVDSKREMHEYDSKTQGAIRKALFDQQQQQMGLPTSDELRQEALLAQARQAPNSPI